MKILIIGQYYKPDNFLINEIAEDLAKRGHKITVLTGLPDYSTNKVPKEYKFFKRRHEFLNEVEIYRVPIIARHKGKIFRVLNYLSFFITSSIFALFHKFDCDVIFSYQTAPVLMINPAIILKKKMKKPLFIYCLDIWPDQLKVLGIKENNLIFKIIRKYCRYAYNNAEVVGISSEPFRKYMINVNKVKKEKIIYLPQHSNAITINKKEKDSKNEIVNFIFAGNIGYQQNVECILKAISLINTEKLFHVHIYGDGSNLYDCKKLANELGIEDRVSFYGRVSKEELSLIYGEMDALLLTLCSEKKIGYSANTVPAKFQNYLSIGKPIFASIDGGAKDLINEILCGEAVSADDYKGFAQILEKYIINPRAYTQYGINAKEYFYKNYTKELVLDKLESILYSMQQ